MQQGNQQVRQLRLSDSFRPSGSTLQYVMKCIVLAQLIRQPPFGGRCGESHHRYFHPSTPYHSIWSEGMTVLTVGDIRGKQRITRRLLKPPHRHRSRLYIMVAHRSGVITHEAAHLPHSVRPVIINMIKEIRFRTTLNHISTVEQQHVLLAIPSALFSHKSTDTLQASVPLVSVAEVVGKVVPVNISREKYMKRHVVEFFLVFRSAKSQKTNDGRKAHADDTRMVSVGTQAGCHSQVVTDIILLLDDRPYGQTILSSLVANIAIIQIREIKFVGLLLAEFAHRGQPIVTN